MTNNDSVLETYLKEVLAASKPIDGEQAALESARDGDVDARKRIIQSYLYRAAEIGMSLAPSKLSRMDAVQEANLVRMCLVERGINPGSDLESEIRKHFDKL